MSAEKRGTGYTVRWRDSSGKQCSQQVQLWRDAVKLDGEMKRKKAMGELIAHEKGTIRLEDFWEVWWNQYAVPNLSRRTRDVYGRLWSRHVAPALGTSTKLKMVSHESVSVAVSKWSRDLAPSSTRKVLAVLQSVLSRAVEWGYIASNPAIGIKKPPLVQRRGRALTPEQIDKLVSELPNVRSRAFVMLLAWTGLRPGELRGLRWDDLSDELIRVERAVSDDVIGPTKTKSRRSVDFRDEPRKALLEWYVANGQPAPSSMVFGPWTDNGYRMWQRQVFKPAAERAGLKGVVPYDLRHTFASRLIREGLDPVEVARQLGHSPVLTLETYSHEFEQERKSVREGCASELGIVGILRARRGI